MIALEAQCSKKDSAEDRKKDLEEGNYGIFKKKSQYLIQPRYLDFPTLVGLGPPSHILFKKLLLIHHRIMLKLKLGMMNEDGKLTQVQVKVKSYVNLEQLFGHYSSSFVCTLCAKCFPCSLKLSEIPLSKDFSRIFYCLFE